MEDEPDVMLAATELFRSIGYDVLTARRGRDKLEILQRRPEVEVIISDVIMSQGMSGLTLARAARQILPDLKIILASGYPIPALQAMHGELGDFTLISKPYRMSELARQLRTADDKVE